MRNHLRRLAAILSALALAAGLTACGQPGASSGSAPSPSRRIVRIRRASRFPRGDFPSFCHGSASGPPSLKCPNNRTNDALS